MRLKKLFCGLFAAFILNSCAAEEEIFVPQPVIPDGWQTYSLQIDDCTDFRTGETSEDPLSLEIALPENWTLDDSVILDGAGGMCGECVDFWSGYHGDLNCNDFYMMLELDGHVTENGVDGSRRRIELPNGNAWRQGIHEDGCTVWEYYFRAGEGHVRFLFYTAPDEMPDEEIILGILGSITVK
ncbi:MAG: hypothetical protein IKM31_09860 [Oscillospiraceae bacterium]|nr:hypothetical protein [Oscillospiraceae bacterium]